ncbi:MAG TPA: hypothetical protein VKU40_03670, partial [Thermoanaerobaculia bacterium]|nr:hypothetical protein [Thermoanaerobaculia bacterium]
MPDGPRRSLFARLAVVLLVLLVGVGAVWVVTTLVTTGLYQEELEQRLNRDLARSLLADTAILERSVGEEIGEGVDGGLGPDLEPDLEPELEHIFHTLMVVNPRIEVYLLDVEGHILAFSAPEGRVVREQVSIDPVHAFLAGERRLPIRGDDPRQEKGVKIFSAAPIEAPSGAVVGYLYVVLGGEGYDSAAALLRSSYLLRLAAVGAVVAVLVALAAGLFLF